MYIHIHTKNVYTYSYKKMYIHIHKKNVYTYSYKKCIYIFIQATMDSTSLRSNRGNIYFAGVLLPSQLISMNLKWLSFFFHYIYI